LEPRFGRDFSGVRVHSDGKAAESARAVGADAYTVGAHIVFAAGKWSGAVDGLLAHELAHVAQQPDRLPTAGERLPVSGPGDAAEREADRIAGDVLAGRRVEAVGQASTGLSREASGDPPTGPLSVATPGVGIATHIEGSSASLSWIDLFSPAGLFVSDSEPPDKVSAAFVTGTTGFRFSNYVHAWAKASDGVHIQDSGFYPDSGLYKGPSYLGIPSLGYPIAQSKTKVTEGGVEAIQFDQTAGARTVSGGVIGGAFGEKIGGGAGSVLDYAASAVASKAKRALSDVPLLGALANNLLGDSSESEEGGYFERTGKDVGRSIGTATANRVTNFPPIWTRIRLTLKANGERHCQLLVASLFPSVSFYCEMKQLSTRDALWTEQGIWERFGWNGGNPWGESRPTVEP
jgi:hypothetical protein